MQYTKIVSEILKEAMKLARMQNGGVVKPEHVLAAVVMYPSVKGYCEEVGIIDVIKEKFGDLLFDEQVVVNEKEKVVLSFKVKLLLLLAMNIADRQNRNGVNIYDLLLVLKGLEDESLAKLYLQISLDVLCEFEQYIYEKYCDDDNVEGAVDLPKMFEYDNLFSDTSKVVCSLDHVEGLEDEGDADEVHEVEYAVDVRKGLYCISEKLRTYGKVIGMEEEVSQTLEILCRRDCCNVLHVGESGVGKTALIYALASRINKGDVPDCLKGSKIYELQLSSLMLGQQYRGEVEVLLVGVFEYLKSRKNPILYIDDIHMFVNMGQIGEGSNDIVGVLKRYIESSNVKVIGSTSHSDCQRYMTKYKALLNRFQQMIVNEPDREKTLGIIKGVKSRYQKYHGVKIGSDILNDILDLSERYLPNSRFPQKAIRLMDSACSCAVMDSQTNEKAQSLTYEIVLKALSRMCNVSSIENREELKELLTLSERIKTKIYGQDDAIERVVDSIQISKSGLTEGDKPIASFLFVGPTGVGKTEVAKVLSEQLGVKLIRFDMSEYSESHTVSKLIGSPAGYIGYDDGGLLTDAVYKTPHCVLLLDEIEKANSAIYNILLQIMDYGYLTDSKGRKSSFQHVVLILTSNAGAQYAHISSSLGYDSGLTKGAVMKKDLKRIFKPEFLNRLSGTIVFNDIDDKMADMIMDKKLSQFMSLLEKKNISMELSVEARRYLMDKCMTKVYGAREFDRVISSELKPLFVKTILSSVGEKNKKKIRVEYNNGELSISKRAAKR